MKKSQFTTLAVVILGLASVAVWVVLRAIDWGTPFTNIEDYPARLAVWRSDPGSSVWVRHFPDPSSPMLNDAAIYEFQAPMQGTSNFWLYASGTPAGVESERQRVAALGLSPAETPNGNVQWALDESGSSTPFDGSTARFFLSAPSLKNGTDGRAAMFWSDSATGEMIYQAVMD